MNVGITRLSSCLACYAHVSFVSFRFLPARSHEFHATLHPWTCIPCPTHRTIHAYRQPAPPPRSTSPPVHLFHALLTLSFSTCTLVWRSGALASSPHGVYWLGHGGHDTPSGVTGVFWLLHGVIPPEYCFDEVL